MHVFNIDVPQSPHVSCVGPGHWPDPSHSHLRDQHLSPEKVLGGGGGGGGREAMVRGEGWSNESTAQVKLC